MEPLTTARITFGNNQNDNHRQHGQSDLCRPASIAHPKPDIENTGRQGMYRKEIDGAKIVQRFHQGNNNANNDGRTRQWQGNRHK